MTQPLFIGVDGGATKCIVRVEDEAGRLLGQETSGSANIRLSVTETWQAIYAALTRILQPLAIPLAGGPYHFHAGMGLAGCEVTEAYQAFLHTSHPFATLKVVSDAHTACLGAHAGQDGAIIIAGTGAVGFHIQHGMIAKVGGFGFPHDDEGGGAWLGLEAVKLTLQWLDGRLPESAIAKSVYAYFAEDQHRLVSWANQANSTQFASLAPFVVQQAAESDATAINLLKQAAHAMDRMAEALYRKQQESSCPLPCALIGSVALFLEPYLSAALRARLRPCQLSPDAGAVLLVRNGKSLFKDER